MIEDQAYPFSRDASAVKDFPSTAVLRRNNDIRTTIMRDRARDAGKYLRFSTDRRARSIAGIP
jgi:hypothetical protein